MDNILASNENFNITRGNQTICMPFASPDTQSALCSVLATSSDIIQLSSNISSQIDSINSQIDNKRDYFDLAYNVVDNISSNWTLSTDGTWSLELINVELPYPNMYKWQNSRQTSSYHLLYNAEHHENKWNFSILAGSKPYNCDADVLKPLNATSLQFTVNGVAYFISRTGGNDTILLSSDITDLTSSLSSSINSLSNDKRDYADLTYQCAMMSNWLLDVNDQQIELVQQNTVTWMDNEQRYALTYMSNNSWQFLLIKSGGSTSIAALSDVLDLSCTINDVNYTFTRRKNDALVLSSDLAYSVDALSNALNAAISSKVEISSISDYIEPAISSKIELSDVNPLLSSKAEFYGIANASAIIDVVQSDTPVFPEGYTVWTYVDNARVDDVTQDVMFEYSDDDQGWVLKHANDSIAWWDDNGTNGEYWETYPVDTGYGIYDSDDNLLLGTNASPFPDISFSREITTYLLSSNMINCMSSSNEQLVYVQLPDEDVEYSRALYVVVSCDNAQQYSLSVASDALLQTANGGEVDFSLAQDARTVLHFIEIRKSSPESNAAWVVQGGANGSSIDVVAPSISALPGQAADAKTTGEALSGKLSISGGTMTGALAFTNNIPDGGYRSIYYNGDQWHFKDHLGDVVTLPKYANSTIALAAPSATADNLAALDAAGNPVDSGIAKTNVALAADLRYRIRDAVLMAKLPDGVIFGSSADNPLTYTLYFDTSSKNWFLGNEGIGFPCLWDADGTNGRNAAVNVYDFYYDGALMSGVPDLLVHRALADGTVNLITATDETSIDIELPPTSLGYSRDFYLTISCDSPAPTLNRPAGALFYDAKGKDADFTLESLSTTVLHFTEVKEAVISDGISAEFCVMGGANGGGSLDPSALSAYMQLSNESSISLSTGAIAYNFNASGTTTSADVMRRTDVDNAISSKLESSSAAPAFDELSTYYMYDYVTYEGCLYRFTETHAPGAWQTSSVAAVDMTTPDATLDITSDGKLRVVAADGTQIWKQGYTVSQAESALSCTLSDECVNGWKFGVNQVDEISLYLPAIVDNKAHDLLFDITTPALVSDDTDTWPAAFDTTSSYVENNIVSYSSQIWRCISAVAAGSWTGTANWTLALPSFSLQGMDNDYSVVVEKNQHLSSITQFQPGSLSRMLFTMTALSVNDLPTWQVSRIDVQHEGGSI